jgi:7,8-dihydropterin-6-yl-methyl-4-(beta-D-ribofuranosyl)aminobenzene 5'-phosphate synthase
MKKSFVISIIVILISAEGAFPMQTQRAIEMTIVYDNNPYDKNLRADWGFSCFVSGPSKTLLFDTGKDGQILLSNMKRMGINPRSVEAIILSHEHKDHTGGLSAILKEKPGIEVWVPYFFSSSFRETVKKNGGRFVEVNGFRNICAGAYTTGVIQGWIKEQSLVLESPPGLILLTGCAHPRIVNIIDRVRGLTGKDIHLAIGGFHLAGFPAREIREIIAHFREAGVRKVGPCHCSGDEARKLFKMEYGKDFVQVGVGRRIQIQ